MYNPQDYNYRDDYYRAGPAAHPLRKPRHRTYGGDVPKNIVALQKTIEETCNTVCLGLRQRSDVALMLASLRQVATGIVVQSHWFYDRMAPHVVKSMSLTNKGVEALKRASALIEDIDGADAAAAKLKRDFRDFISTIAPKTGVVLPKPQPRPVTVHVVAAAMGGRALSGAFGAPK